jgi:transcription initiation factor TFIIIB Brf1 subunit/transcription initiation factor TFIIB
MKKCEECGNESWRDDVCVFCGLVFEDHPIDYSLPEKLTDKQTKEKYFYINVLGLSPDVIKLKGNRRWYKKGKEYHYILAYEFINKVCSNLQLPNIVLIESLNIYSNVREKDPDFFVKYQLEPSYLAFIKIGCKLNDYPITNKELSMFADYFQKTKKKPNYEYMDKKFNDAYIGCMRLLKIKIEKPEYPKYIDFVCQELGIPEIITKVHEHYSRDKKYYKSHYKLEGYLLALIRIVARNILFKRLKLSDLAKKFGVSANTISAREKDIATIWAWQIGQYKEKVIWRGYDIKKS